MLATLWLLMHGYHGLTGDGQIYAFQALARLHPQLETDLYLQNTSQDQFTLFSPLYAQCIGLMGLENAARLLTLVFTVWFLVAAWSLVRGAVGRDAAWAAVAFLLIVAGIYGASGVFRVLQPFLTARLPAEALIITALGCQVRGMKWLGLSLALMALLIHPLMALPGLLLVICLWVPARTGVVGAIVGVLATLTVAVVATRVPLASAALTVMDAPWLNVVQERSQFLFLQLWSIHDWNVNALPFLSLGFTAIAVPDDRIRRLCAAAALVGAAGLAVALIGSSIGPVAILVQGQAWRWVWITVLIGAVLVPFTALQIWKDENYGPLCAVLLVSGWTLPALDGTACMMLGLILWLARSHTPVRPIAGLRWTSAALAMAIVAWIAVKYRVSGAPLELASGRETLGVAQQIRGVFALRIPAVLLGGMVWCGIRVSRATWVPAVLSAMLAAFSAFILPAAFRQSRTLAAAADIREFTDWTSVIPPASTVLIVPPRDVGAFVWFTLIRPNYLTVDESAGVVFSRATALEVKRRSEVLLPLWNPDWKILARLRAELAHRRGREAGTHPLTPEKLIQVCTDPQLGFVISQEKLGFDPLPHKQAGAWKDWNLYDCRKVRSAASTTGKPSPVGTQAGIAEM